MAREKHERNFPGFDQPILFKVLAMFNRGELAETRQRLGMVSWPSGISLELCGIDLEFFPESPGLPCGVPRLVPKWESWLQGQTPNKDPLKLRKWRVPPQARNQNRR